MSDLIRSKRWLAIIPGVLSIAIAMADDAALAAAGKRHFIRCAACHTIDASAPALFGPHLEGIVGRQAGSLEGFEYTDPDLKARSFVWDEAYFDEWLERPQHFYQGMCLPFMGLPNPEARKALVAYLRNPG